MIIPSGSTDRKIPFIAVDATDYVTRETGLSAFTVYRSRDGGAATAYTTPTITEASSANMPGLYWLTIDEDTTIASGHDCEEYVLHITCTGMAPVTLTITIERVKFTEGQSATMANSAVDADIERIAGTAVTSASGRMEVNTSHIAGAAVSTSSAQLGVNVVNAGGTAWGSGAITAASIASGAITSAKFAANALDAVWSTATRLLTAGTNIVLAKGTGITGFNDLDAAAVTAAVPSANANADALLDRAAGVETGLTVRQWLRLGAAALFGKASGLDTTTAVFRDTSDTKNRISATVDVNGNRTAVTLDAT